MPREGDAGFGSGMQDSSLRTDGGERGESSTLGTERSGEINIELQVAALATELGFQAGEYEVVDVWLADSDGVVEVDLAERDSGGDA